MEKLNSASQWSQSFTKSSTTFYGQLPPEISKFSHTLLFGPNFLKKMLSKYCRLPYVPTPKGLPQ